MLLELKDVFQNEGEKLDLKYEMDLSQVELDGIKPFVAPIKVRVAVENRAGTVRLKADAAFDFFHPCDRCTVETVSSFAYTFQHVLVPFLNDDSNEEFVLVEDGVLDLDELLRADILLELPTKYLCREDCRGLCPQCGKNMNEGLCDCVTHQVDPRLEILKKLID